MSESRGRTYARECSRAKDPSDRYPIDHQCEGCGEDVNLRRNHDAWPCVFCGDEVCCWCYVGHGDEVHPEIYAFDGVVHVGFVGCFDPSG